MLIEESLKKLVRLNLVYVELKDGFKYMITDTGINLIEQVEDTYSEQYSEVVASIFKKYNVNQPSQLDEALKKARAKREEEQ